MGTQQNTLLGIGGPKKPPITGTVPWQLQGMPTAPTMPGVQPQQQTPSTLLPSTAPAQMQQPQMLGATTPSQQPPTMLGLTPVAGPELSGADRYNEDATNAVRDKFALWNDQQFGQDTAALEQQLRNRGIRPGDPAYNTELQRLRETQGKLRESSNLEAVLKGGQEAERFLGMDDKAAQSNLGRQLAVAGNARADNADVRAETEQRRDAQRYNNDQSAGIVGQGLELLDKTGVLGKVGSKVGGLLGLGGSGASAAASGAGLLGLGGGLAPVAPAGAIIGTEGALAGLGGASGVGAGSAATGAAAGATGTGAMSTVLAAVPWVAAAAVAAAVIAKNAPKSSPMNNYDPKAGGWSKPENWGGESYPPEALNRVFGPALQAFKQSGGDVKAALAAIGQPQSELEKHMLERGLLHLFSGTGNPMRQIAEENNFGKGPWTAGSDEKKQLLDELGIKQ